MDRIAVLTTVVLVSILQIVPGVLSGCSNNTQCVPEAACQPCIDSKCQMAQNQNGGVPVDCSKMSPYIGGNQCCDSERAAALSRRRKRQTYNFVIYPTRKWGNPVFYALDDSTGSVDFSVIPVVLSYIAQQTCLRFERVAVDSGVAHITYSIGSACTAYVGKSESVSTVITVTPDCLESWGDVLYYTCQTLGMFHQSQRPDRNNYITINLDNTDPTHDGDFTAVFTDILTTHGVPYDYASIQHFPGTIYSDNGLNTITTNDPIHQTTIGQRVELSFLDAKQLNILYCQNTCLMSPLLGTCQEGGYQDPNNCNQCKCPDGLAGQLCEGYEDTTGSSCGGSVEASPTEMSITSPGYYTPGLYTAHSTCTWIIEAPKGGDIVLHFTGAFGIYQDDQTKACFHWLEIRCNNSLNETGQRFCGQILPQSSIVCQGPVLLIFRSNFSVIDTSQQRGFQILYKIVNADPCAYVTCSNGGSCNGGSCVCPTGFSGPRCEIEVPSTVWMVPSTVWMNPSPTVFPTNPPFTDFPTNPPPLTGVPSNPPPSGCTPNPCQNNGTCSVNGGKVSCSCINGFKGQYCTNATCGACNTPAGVLNAKCIIPESPARICQVTQFISTTSRWWWFGCRTSYRAVTRNVNCTWAVCCDGKTDFGNGCGVLGWGDFCQCPVSCGGGIQTRRLYGITGIDRVGKRCYGVVGPPQQQYCGMTKCKCPSSSSGKCLSSGTACNSPNFVESGAQCVKNN